MAAGQLNFYFSGFSFSGVVACVDPTLVTLVTTIVYTVLIQMLTNAAENTTT